MTTWVSTEGDAELITSIWADAAEIEAETLGVILRAAQTACEAFAGALHGNTVVPDSHKLAVILHARHLWASASGGNSQSFGPDGFEISASTWPLVMAARDLLRPKRSPFSQIRGLR